MRLVSEAVAQLAKTMEAHDRERMMAYNARITDAARKVAASAPSAMENSTDDRIHAQLRAACAKLLEEVNVIVQDSGKEIAVSALYTAAKYAAASTVGMVLSAKSARAKITDARTAEELDTSTEATIEAVNAFIAALKYVFFLTRGLIF